MRMPICVAVAGCLVATSAQAATYYVDGSIASSACTTYAVATRGCGSGTATAYKTLAGAAAVTNSGDIVEIRGGVYLIPSDTTTSLSRSGSQGNPITYRGYQSEAVIFKGVYDADRDGDGIRDWDENGGSGDATGPLDGDRGIGIRITGSYIRLSRVRIAWLFTCLEVTGSYNTIDEVVAHDCWEGGVTVADGDFNTFRYNAGFRTRHRSGGHIESPASASSIVRGNVFYRNLFWKNGRQLPNDAQVLPFTGDPNGGGNSDGLGASKECSDMVPGYALCRETTIQENISWQNTDDCYDMSIGGSWIINNIGDNCGPNARVGWKMLRAQMGLTFSGGIFRGNRSSNSLDWGTRVRFMDTSSTGTSSYLLHTLATGTYSQPGILVSEVSDTSRCTVRNNLAWNNDSDFSLGGCTQSSNHSGASSGVPSLADQGFNSTSALAAAESCLTNAPHNTSVQSCWQALYNAYYTAYRPAAGSGVIDRGLIVAGYHCPLPDDRGQDAGAACRHWVGAAPDQGPFEFGVTGNPDKTRCSAVGEGACTVAGPGITAPAAPSSVRIVR